MRRQVCERERQRRPRSIPVAILSYLATRCPVVLAQPHDSRSAASHAPPSSRSPTPPVQAASAALAWSRTDTAVRALSSPPARKSSSPCDHRGPAQPPPPGPFSSPPWPNSSSSPLPLHRTLALTEPLSLALLSLPAPHSPALEPHARFPLPRHSLLPVAISRRLRPSPSRFPLPTVLRSRSSRPAPRTGRPSTAPSAAGISSGQEPSSASQRRLGPSSLRGSLLSAGALPEAPAPQRGQGPVRPRSPRRPAGRARSLPRHLQERPIQVLSSAPQAGARPVLAAARGPAASRGLPSRPPATAAAAPASKALSFSRSASSRATRSLFPLFLFLLFCCCFCYFKCQERQEPLGRTRVQLHNDDRTTTSSRTTT